MLATTTGTTRISVHQKRRATLRLPHLIPQGHNVMLDVTEMQRGSSKIFRNKHFIKQQKTSYCVEEQSQSIRFTSARASLPGPSHRLFIPKHPLVKPIILHLLAVQQLVKPAPSLLLPRKQPGKKHCSCRSSGAKRAEGSAGLWLILSRTLLPALCTAN